LRHHKGAIVFNLQPTGNFDKPSGKFTFVQALTTESITQWFVTSLRYW